jgi:hypothetical protein
MRFCATYSDSHRRFLDEFFLKTFPFEFDVSLLLERMPQKCANSGWLFSDGWRDQMIEKQRFINKHLNSTPDPTVVFCDVDIAFYGDIHDDLQICLGDNDIAFLKDHNSDRFGRNGGFIVVRSNEKTKKLFATVLSKLQKLSKEKGPSTGFDTSEQHMINSTLDSMPEIKWTFLPPRYYTHGLYIEGIKKFDEEKQNGLWWEQKDKEERENVFIPDDIKIHHANWASGVERKLDLLGFICRKVKERGDGK